MRAEGFKWDHEIQIALPRSYYKTEGAYPVLWVTDGSYWFETAVEIVNVYAQKHVSEMIIVAVGVPSDALKEFQSRRRYDFSPTPEEWAFEGFGGELLKGQLKEMEERLKAAGMPLPKEQGGGPGFLAFLVDTVRPALSRVYRMSDDHTLFGDSAGGSFCTYAFLARPRAFDKYICGSPSLYAGNFELFRLEERYSKAHKDLPAKVFFGAGEAEVLEGGMISAAGIVSSMTRMAEILKLRRYPSLKLHVRIFPGEDHGSVIPMNLSWGLRTLWEGEGNKARQ